MGKFIVIGERIHCISPEIKKAIEERDPAPILKRAKDQIAGGATYIDVNIGPAESDGEEIMKWAVELIQGECDNIPLALDTANMKAIEAGIKVYNRSKGKPIVNSADAGDRVEYIDLAANNDAIVIALCSKGVVAANNEERMGYLQEMLERGLGLGMDDQDLWFDPLFLVIKGMQEKQMEIIQAIREIRYGSSDYWHTL
jgi:5-methyltetrahydrofolate corrinoid/iron sulfur protein methyltransferase